MEYYSDTPLEFPSSPLAVDRFSAKYVSSTKDDKIQTTARISDDDELPVQPPVMRRQDVEVGSRTDLSIRGELVIAGKFSSNSMLTLLHFPPAETKMPGLEDIVTWQVSARTRAIQPGHHQEEKPHITTKLVG
jgi:hypothetical protein